MINICVLQTCLFALSASEWVEITQLDNPNRHQSGKIKKKLGKLPKNCHKLIYLGILVDANSTSNTSVPSVYFAVSGEQQIKGTAGNGAELVEKNDQLREAPSTFMNALKNIQSHLMDFKGKSLQVKVQHLEKLRNELLHDISELLFIHCVVLSGMLVS